MKEVIFSEMAANKIESLNSLIRESLLKNINDNKLNTLRNKKLINGKAYYKYHFNNEYNVIYTINDKTISVLDIENVLEKQRIELSKYLIENNDIKRLFEKEYDLYLKEKNTNKNLFYTIIFCFFMALLILATYLFDPKFDSIFSKITVVLLVFGITSILIRKTINIVKEKKET